MRKTSTVVTAVAVWAWLSMPLAQASPGDIRTLAGGGVGDGGLATEAALGATGIAADGEGNVYIADAPNNRIRKVDWAGRITTVAGSGRGGCGLWGQPDDCGDGGPATSATLFQPRGVAVDREGNLYIADTLNHRIRRVDTDGVITTIGGTGSSGYAEGCAINTRGGQASFSHPSDVEVDALGTVYVADSGNDRVRGIGPLGIGGLSISTNANCSFPIAGGGSGELGDGGPATEATLSSPQGVAVDSLGNLYIADYGQHRVRKVVLRDRGVTTPSIGQCLFSTCWELVPPKTVKIGLITTVAGSGSQGFAGDGGPANNAALNFPTDVVVAADGALLIADYSNGRVRRVDEMGSITTLAGQGALGQCSGSDVGPALEVCIAPLSLAASGAETLISGQRVWALDSSRTIRRFAGNGSYTFAGDGLPAREAGFSNPSGLAWGPDGSLFVADRNHNRIRKIDAAGIVSTVAGGWGEWVHIPDGSPATSGTIWPYDVAVSENNLFLTDGHMVRKVDLETGIIATVAGSEAAGYCGDGEPAISACLNEPRSIALSQGILYIADTANNRIRAVDLESGIIATVAGTGEASSSGDGGDAASATVWSPAGLAVGPQGDLYFSELSGRVRRIDSQRIVTSVAEIRGVDVAVDEREFVFVAQWGEVSMVSPSGIVTRIAGTGNPYSGSDEDGVPATSAAISPESVAIDPLGDILIADRLTGRIRVVEGPGA